MNSSGTTLKKLVIKDTQIIENGNTSINGGKITNNKNCAVYIKGNYKVSSLIMTSGYFEGNEGSGAIRYTDNSLVYVSGNVCSKTDTQNYISSNAGTCLFVSGSLDYTKNPYYVSSSSSSYKTLCIQVGDLVDGVSVVSGSTDANIGTYTLQSSD